MTRPTGELGPRDRGDVQADVLDALGFRYAHHLLICIDDAAAARRLLADAIPLVPRWPVHGPHKPDLAATIGISGNGLLRLGLDPEFVDGLGPAFAGGMASRADVLGDAGASHPDHWLPGFEEFDANILLWIQGRHVHEVDAEAARWHARLHDKGLHLVHHIEAAMHGNHREHFGFADGFSQPLIAGARKDARENSGDGGELGRPGEEGELTRGGREEPIPAGEFLLGHPDAMGVVAPIGYHPLARNGTILVWRQLHQDVAAFRAFVARAAVAKALDPVLVAAKLIGRWQDGTSLAVAPTGPPGGPGRDPGLDPAAPADIRYGDDPLGLLCPVGAHVRRANPRDGMPQRTLANRHRIIRRGLPYGPPLPPDAPDDGVDRGLVFAGFNANLARQFEFLQSLWFNDGGELNLGTARDPLVGAGGGDHFVVAGHPPHVLTGLPSFVTTRAGEYFFVPGISALRALASG